MIKYRIDVLALLKLRGYTVYRLRADYLMGEATIQKIRAGGVVYGHTLDLLCRLLDCQPGDILEYIPDGD